MLKVKFNFNKKKAGGLSVEGKSGEEEEAKPSAEGETAIRVKTEEDGLQIDRTESGECPGSQSVTYPIVKTEPFEANESTDYDRILVICETKIKVEFDGQQQEQQQHGHFDESVNADGVEEGEANAALFQDDGAESIDPSIEDVKSLATSTSPATFFSSGHTSSTTYSATHPPADQTPEFPGYFESSTAMAGVGKGLEPSESAFVSSLTISSLLRVPKKKPKSTALSTSSHSPSLIAFSSVESSSFAASASSSTATTSSSPSVPSTSLTLSSSPIKAKKSVRSSMLSSGSASTKPIAKPPKFAKSYHCPNCRQVFHESFLLRQHLLVHFKCSKCDLQFSSRASLKLHVESVHWRIRNLCDRLDLPQPVLDAATTLFKDSFGLKKSKKFAQESLVSTCLFAATRQLDMNFPAKTFCKVVKLKISVLFKIMRIIENELNLCFSLSTSALKREDE